MKRVRSGTGFFMLVFMLAFVGAGIAAPAYQEGWPASPDEYLIGESHLVSIGDLTGDGNPEIIVLVNGEDTDSGTSDLITQILILNNTGKVLRILPDSVEVEHISRLGVNVNGSKTDYSMENGILGIADFTGDGIDDLVLYGVELFVEGGRKYYRFEDALEKDKRIYVHSFDGRNFTETAYEVPFADEGMYYLGVLEIDGHEGGLIETRVDTGSTVKLTVSTIESEVVLSGTFEGGNDHPQDVLYGDFDNDGAAEIVACSNKYGFVYRGGEEIRKIEPTKYSILDCKKGDINKDGVPEVVMLETDNYVYRITIWIDASEMENMVEMPPTLKPKFLEIIDYEKNDSILEFLLFTEVMDEDVFLGLRGTYPAEYDIYIYRLNEKIASAFFSAGIGEDRRIDRFGDFDGDGNMDMLYHDGNRAIYSFKKYLSSDLVPQYLERTDYLDGRYFEKWASEFADLDCDGDLELVGVVDGKEIYAWDFEVDYGADYCKEWVEPKAGGGADGDGGKDDADIGDAEDGTGPSGGDEKRTVHVLANEIDKEVSAELISKLEESFTVEFSTPLSLVDEDYLVILGGPDAPNGVGVVVAGLLDSAEEENIRSLSGGFVYSIDGAYKEGQKVILVAGKNRFGTRDAGLENFQGILDQLED